MTIYPAVDALICQSCVTCLARQVCRTRALFRIDPGEPYFIEESRCNACGKCIPACPFNAIVYRTTLGGTGKNDRFEFPGVSR